MSIDINRINELARKSKTVGLTDVEKEEQAVLRAEYIKNVRESLRANLNNISIVEKYGNVTDLGKKFGGITDTES